MISEEIKNFMVLAECLSFSKAAQYLNIAQPAISRQISRLEMDLGVKLFNRTTRKVSLTAAGSTYLSLCRAFTAGSDSLLDNYPRDSITELRRSIVFGVGALVEDTATMRILESFSANNPQVMVSIVQYKDLDIIKALDDGKIDVAIVVLPLVPSSPEYDHCIVERSRIKVAVWEGHPLAKKERVTVQELKDENFIMNSEAPSDIFNRLFKLCDSSNFFPKISGKTTSSQLSLMMVGARQGITFSGLHTLYKTPKNVVFCELSNENLEPGALEAAVAHVWRKDQASGSQLMQRLIGVIRENACSD